MSEVTPIEFLQTGFNPIKMYLTRAEYTTAPEYGGMDQDLLNPRFEDKFDATITGHDETDLDMGVNIVSYVSKGLFGQAWGWIRERYSVSTWADINAADLMDALEDWYYEFIRGLHNLRPRRIKDDGSASTDLTDDIQGLVWYRQEAVAGSSDRHWQYTRRWAYLFGQYYSKMIPGFVDKLDATTETNRVRVEQILAAFAAIEFGYLFPMMALNSERVAFGLGAMHSGKLNPKILQPEEYAGNYDNVWYELSKEYKQHVAGTAADPDAYMVNHVDFTGDFWRYDFLESTNFDVALQRARETFKVSKFGQNMARIFTGIGLADLGDRTVHFANLFTLHMPDHANYPANDKYGVATTWDHGVSMWCTGLDLAAVLEWLYSVRSVREDCLNLVKNRKHYTWTDGSLESIVENMFVDFNFVKSISGYCQPIIQPALDRRFRYADATKTTANGITFYGEDNIDVDDPEDWDGGTVWYSDSSTPLDNHWVWLSLYIWEGMNESMYLFSPGGMTLEEMSIDLLTGILFDGNDPDVSQKFQHTRINAIEIIDCYDHNKFYGFMSGDNGSAINRTEDVYDILYGSVGNDTFTFRNGLYTRDPGESTARRYTEPRPKGLKEKAPTFVPYWGKRETKLAMFEQILSIVGANSPFADKKEEKPATEKKPLIITPPKDPPKDKPAGKMPKAEKIEDPSTQDDEETI